MSTSVETPKVNPGEVLQKLLSRVYVLYFRKGNNPHPMTKNFYSSAATLMETVTLAKRHCENIGARFVRIEPFISDLKKDENQYSGITEQMDED